MISLCLANKDFANMFIMSISSQNNSKNSRTRHTHTHTHTHTHENIQVVREEVTTSEYGERTIEHVYVELIFSMAVPSVRFHYLLIPLSRLAMFSCI